MVTLHADQWGAPMRPLLSAPHGDPGVIPSEESMQALVGYRFPGGTYRIEHWENFLLSEATGIDPLPDGLAHPAHLFHVAINGVGTSISELFRLAGSGPAAPVSIDYYDWRIYQPLREDETYSLSGGIADFTRTAREGSPTRDSMRYEIDMADTSGDRVAEVAFRWHYWRMAKSGATA
jgi:hypothetical protein